MQTSNKKEEREWDRNERGGWQPPDEEIDLSDMPELANPSLNGSGPYPEYLKRKRERRKTSDNKAAKAS